MWKRDLLESAGHKDEALAVYEKALEAFWTANPDAEEPPAQLMARRDALLRGLVHEERRCAPAPFPLLAASASDRFREIIGCRGRQPT